jgi:hypothetical protein
MRTRSGKIPRRLLEASRVSCCLLGFIAAGERPVEVPPFDIGVLVEPISKIFQSSEEVTIRVLIHHLNGHCRPFYVDPFFSSNVDSIRPFSILKFEIVDGNGNDLKGASVAPLDPPSIRAENFFSVDCDHVFGIEVNLNSASNWNYSLVAGKYRIRASIEMRLRSFLDRNPELFNRLVALSGLSRETVKLKLPEGTFISNWAEFEVTK